MKTTTINAVVTISHLLAGCGKKTVPPSSTPSTAAPVTESAMTAWQQGDTMWVNFGNTNTGMVIALLGSITLMKNAIIAAVMAATILIAGCGKKDSSSTDGKNCSPTHSAASNRRPAGQSDGPDNLSATLAADRALPAAVAELGSLIARCFQ
jgi:outer membrane murein-binding lipoprotein Lpp